MLEQAIRGPSHLFYDRLNAELDEAKFDLKVEKLCEGFFEQEEKRGRPSIAPGMYFRMLLVGTSRASNPSEASSGGAPTRCR